MDFQGNFWGSIFFLRMSTLGHTLILNMFLEFAISPFYMQKKFEMSNSGNRVDFFVNRVNFHSPVGKPGKLIGWPMIDIFEIFACSRAKLQILQTWWVLEYVLELISVEKKIENLIKLSY